jgi:threonine synthase
MNPTGSFKDYGMTAGVSQARRLGSGAVACASTGNTSASMAAYAARASMKAFVFIPAGKVALGKLSQSLEYGATVVEIEGNFDDAMRLVRVLSEECGIYLLNSINPFRLEGQKAIAIELMEQLEWQPPDWIVLPGGNLGNVSAIGKGLRELLDLGFISSLPRLAVVQAEGASPFYRFISSAANVFQATEHPYTLATAISIGNPVSWQRAARSLRWTDGTVARVSEQSIADAKALIGRDGIGCKPASAATLAGIKTLADSQIIKSGDTVVGMLTGNLLKDPAYTVNYHAGRLEIERDGATEPIAGRYSNKSIRVPASEAEIRAALNL